MKLLDLSGPYEKKRAISYAADGNTVVLKTVPLQLVAGNMYITRTKYDECNNPHCDMYIWFPSENIGILQQYLFNMDVTVDAVQDFSMRNGFDSSERYVTGLQSTIKSCEFISFAQIKLMEYLDPELVKPCQEARAVFDKRRSEKEQQEKQARAVEDAAYTAEMNTVAATLLVKAVHMIQNCGTIYQEEITVYQSRYESSTYGSLFGVLASIYAVKIPISVLGWIAKRLVLIKVENGTMSEYRYRKINSTTLRKYIGELIQAVQADTDLSVITKWLNAKGIVRPVSTQAA